MKKRHQDEVQRLTLQQTQMVSATRATEFETQLVAQQTLVERLKDELARTLSREVSELRRTHKPESEQLALLRSKLDELEQRHQVREVRLQAVVHEVLRHRATQQETSPAEVAALRLALRHKNEQLTNFQAELGRLMSSLAALQTTRT
ncbi:hypothetical protein B566_EDAN012155 [Ephemera danica]|nr:hypothetical protein B566_EDAN012155 [Ephemera danica]